MLRMYIGALSSDVDESAIRSFILAQDYATHIENTFVSVVKSAYDQ